MQNQRGRVASGTVGDGGHGRRPHAAAALAIGLLLLVGCGETESVPPPAPTDATAPEPPASPGAAGAGSPQAQRAPAEQPVVTFGDLADRVNAAWIDVRSYRTRFSAPPPAPPLLASPVPATTATSEAATPVVTEVGATPPVQAAAGLATPVSAAPMEAVRVVVLPDRQQQSLTGAGDDDHEALVVGETLYLRGPLATELLPGADPDGWMSLPLAELSPDSHAGHVLAGLAVPPASPMASLREGLRPQELRDLGPIDVDGRACRAYAGADTTAIGTRQDITVAIDQEGLPCLIETRVGRELVSRVVYDRYNEPVAIEPPAAATPAAGLLPAATPVGRD